MIPPGAEALFPDDPAEARKALEYYALARDYMPKPATMVMFIDPEHEFPKVFVTFLYKVGLDATATTHLQTFRDATDSRYDMGCDAFLRARTWLDANAFGHAVLPADYDIVPRGYAIAEVISLVHCIPDAELDRIAKHES